MKKSLLFLLTLCVGGASYSQNLRPIPQKVKDHFKTQKHISKYNLFTENNVPSKVAKYSEAAKDVSVLKLNSNELQKIVTEKPQSLVFSFPYEGKLKEVELIKNEIFAENFRVNTDKGAVAYTPGVYYYGIVKGDDASIVAISFFKDEVMGVASQDTTGNIILGKVKGSEDYVTYSDLKLNSENSFACSADELLKDSNVLPQFDMNLLKENKMTSNCVRMYFEIGYGPYTQNGANTTTTTNWMTGMFNNIKALYNNDNIAVSMSEIYIWTSTDPYSGTPSNILSQFKTNRPTFNGDVGQLVRNPATTSVAYLDTLCSASNHSYSGVQLSYQNVPTYSWNIEAMTHEIGHSLGSPHTHNCFWNGNSTAIDGCGPASGNNEGCNAVLPTNGGTIMSYCHLVSSVGINFSKGFGEQPGALIRSKVDGSACLGSDCIESCQTTVTGFTTNSVTTNSGTFTITSSTGTSWKYKVKKMDGTVVTTGTTTVKNFTIPNLQENTYYIVQVSNNCTSDSAYERQVLILTDADWCAGKIFTDTGGTSANYGNSESFVKTFLPTVAGQKMSITFTEFDLLSGDYMIVYDGANIASPRFPHGLSISGNTVPEPFNATNASGAITVRFISNDSGVSSGWKANVGCSLLATSEVAVGVDVSVSPIPTKGIVTLSSKNTIESYVITDASGRILSSVEKLNAKSKVLDLAKYPSGTYLITVQTEKGAITKKLIKN